MQSVVADMVRRQASGTIVNIGSTSEHCGQPELAAFRPRRPAWPG
jgi:short-subunit dehydrogenase